MVVTRVCGSRPVQAKPLGFFQLSPLGEPGTGETDIRPLLVTVIDFEGDAALSALAGALEWVRLVVVS